MVVSNVAGVVTSSVATLTVLVPPTLTLQPTNQSGVVGANITLAAAATGTAPLSYQWQHQGTNLASGTTNTLSLLNVQTDDAGAYRVVITNVAGATTSSVASVTVIVPPSILTQPTNATVIAGAPVSFLAEAAGTAPLSYQWYFNTTNAVGTNGPAFGLASVQPTNEGVYHLVVSNVAGMATSSVASLTVLLSPEIALQPSNITAIAGQGVTLHAMATGSAPLEYRWYFNDTILVGTNGPELGFSNIQSSQGGDYKVVVTNSAGSATSTVATITVLVPPSFTLQPTNSFASVGDTVLMSAAASGSAPLGYYWLFNATNIVGAAANLSLPDVHPAQAGEYQAVATNAAGASTSSVALLTILTQPILLSPMTDTNGAFRFLLSGDIGQNYAIEASTNLQTWDQAGTLSNATGQTPFAETNKDFWFRVYRARRIP